MAKTARVITAAAAIMIVVFGSFVSEDSRIVKLFGFGFASAVFIDATIVRMLLVPSTMQLLGARNWWLPKWLDRILPNLNVEGEHHESPTTGDEPDPTKREPQLWSHSRCHTRHRTHREPRAVLKRPGGR